MASADSNLNIKVTVQDKASGPLKSISSEVAGLQKSAGGATSVLSGMAGALTGGFLAGAALSAITQMGAAIGDMALQAGKLDQLQASFEDLAGGVGQSATAMLGAMKSASDGLISDADLILSANKAMLLGVADTAQEMTALLDVARARGAAMGLSTTQAFNDIVTGLGRESALILDNLGITVDLQKVMDNYAASLGLTAGQLDAAQRKQALLNEVMRQSAGMEKPIETAATAWERMSVSIENAKAVLGELFAPAIAAVAQQIAEAAGSVADTMATVQVESAFAGIRQELDFTQNALRQIDIELRRFWDDVGAGFEPSQSDLDYINELTQQAMRLRIEEKGLQEQLGITSDAMMDQRMEASGLSASIASLAATYPAASQVIRDAGQAAIDTTLKMRILSDEMNAMIGRMAGNRAAIENAFLGATDVLGVEGAVSAAIAADRQFQELHAEWVRQGKTSLEMKALERDYLQGINQDLADQRDALREADKAASDYASGGVASINEAYQELRSTASSVLNQALNTGVQLNEPAQYQDAINENARRLAAIANEGLINQSWLAEFKAEAPGIFDEIVNSADPQGAARRLYEEFQLGMRPELIDREMAKQKIKDMILGQQRMDALASELAGELAQEMNIPLQEAMQAAGAALGAGTTKGKTEDGAGSAIADSVRGAVQGIPAIVDDEYTPLYNSGVAIVNAMWDGFSARWQDFADGVAGGLNGLLDPPSGTTTDGATSTTITNNTGTFTLTIPAANASEAANGARRGILDAARSLGMR